MSKKQVARRRLNWMSLQKVSLEAQKARLIRLQEKLKEGSAKVVGSEILVVNKEDLK